MKRKKEIILWFSVVLNSFIGFNALIAGYLFMSDPSGATLHISVKQLQHSPFTNYFIPGIILFSAIGVLSIISAIITVFKWKFHGLFVIAQGAVLLGWIVIQIVLMREFNLLHIIFIILSILLLFLGFRLQKSQKIR